MFAPWDRVRSCCCTKLLFLPVCSPGVWSYTILACGSFVDRVLVSDMNRRQHTRSNRSESTTHLFSCLRTCTPGSTTKLVQPRMSSSSIPKCTGEVIIQDMVIFIYLCRAAVRKVTAGGKGWAGRLLLTFFFFLLTICGCVGDPSQPARDPRLDYRRVGRKKKA